MDRGDTDLQMDMGIPSGNYYAGVLAATFLDVYRGLISWSEKLRPRCKEKWRVIWAASDIPRDSIA